MRAVAQALIVVLPERRRMGRSRLTGLAYTMTNETVRARAVENSAARYNSAAEFWRGLADDGPLPMPPEVLVRVLNVLIEGLTLQWIVTPEMIPDDVIYAAFAALAPDSDAGDTVGGDPAA
jgi:hypothetical protein